MTNNYAAETEIENIITGTRLLDAMIKFCEKEGYSIACWRKEDGIAFEGVMDFTLTQIEEKIRLDEMPAGFIFAPYDRDALPHLVKSQLYFTSEGKIACQPAYEEISERLKQFIEDYKVEENREMSLSSTEKNESRETFEELVEKSVEEIRKGGFLKVVPARCQTFDLKNADIAGIFNHLTKDYPQAFVHVIYTPDTGIWLGASPELLVRVTENRYFETIALAGTQSYNPEIPVNDVAWTQKDIEEQALVCRYIINCFKKIRLREYEENGPKTVVAGNLIHLKTRYMVDMDTVNFPRLGSVMLELLHPTSAVCGMPRAEAAEWIDKFESFDREFFTGYLGPVNLDEQTSIYVNLRCMKFYDGLATLYAGAGITEDSRPDKEWQETEMKMNTLLNSLRGASTSL